MRYVIYSFEGFVLFVLLAQVIVIVVYSFDPRGYAGLFPPPGISIRWYKFFFEYELFLTGLKLSVIIALITTCLTALMSVAVSYVISRSKFKGKELLNTLFLSPWMLPGVVAGSAMLIFFLSIGMLNSFVNLVIAHLILTFPPAYRVTYATMLGFDRTMEEAAMNLGANRFQTFMKVTLPIIKSGVISGAVFAFGVSFNDVAVSAFLCSRKIVTFPVAMFSYLRLVYDPSIAVAAFMTLFVTAVILILIDRMIG
ncbi:MAG: ABC transporter permease, partial [Desulfobacterales bacterium]